MPQPRREALAVLQRIVVTGTILGSTRATQILTFKELVFVQGEVCWIPREE